MVNTDLPIAVGDFFLTTCCTVLPPASAFIIFGLFGFVGLVASVLFLGWMRTAILAGGIAVVRSGDCLFVLLKMVNRAFILFIGDWTISSNSAWSQKKLICGVLSEFVRSRGGRSPCFCFEIYSDACTG